MFPGVFRWTTSQAGYDDRPLVEGLRIYPPQNAARKQGHIGVKRWPASPSFATKKDGKNTMEFLGGYILRDPITL